MTKQGFHWRKIDNSPPLQFLLQILKDAQGPMTQMEIQLEAQRRGSWIANPPTSVAEIGENPGYKTSGGERFPDNKYRYWLIEAPNWTSAWRLIPQFDAETGKRMVSYKIVRRGSTAWHGQAAANADSQPEHKTPDADTTPHGCRNPGCTNDVPAERAREGYMTCCDECFNAWRMSIRPRNTAPSGSAQGGLF